MRPISLSRTFAEWASSTSADTVRWDRYNAALQKGPDRFYRALKRAREVVKRAAALDTGAIEGLYEVDRGFTFTVAFETAAWEVKFARERANMFDRSLKRRCSPTITYWIWQPNLSRSQKLQSASCTKWYAAPRKHIASSRPLGSRNKPFRKGAIRYCRTTWHIHETERRTPMHRWT